MKHFFLLMIFIFTHQLSFAQERTITGIVTDASGVPLSSANVEVQGESKRTSTNNNGNFSIKVKQGKTLLISHTGFENQKVIIDQKNDFRIQMKEGSANVLTEVVVTSLGIKKTRKSLTYSAQELKGEEFTRVKDANIINTIAGKIAGVAVTKSSGGTGGSTKVTIRGNSSFSNNQPLYVIDGIPLFNVSGGQPNDSFGDLAGGNKDGGDVVSLLNPEDFDGMTVLKGAAATILYGSQGSNGVILLSTKKGKENKPTFKFSSVSTFEVAAYLPKFQNSYAISEPTDVRTWGAKQNTKDYVKDFFNVGNTQITSFNFSSGNATNNTSLSYSNTTSSGIIPGNGLKKNNFGIRQSSKYFKDKLNVTANASYTSQSIGNKPVNGYYFNPLTGVYLMPRGNDFDYYKNNYEYLNPNTGLITQKWMTNIDIMQNPYWAINRNKSQDVNAFFNGSIGLDYKINNWLILASRYSYNRVESDFNKEIYATTQGTLASQQGRYIDINSLSTQRYADFIATFNPNIGSNFTLSGNLGTSILNTMTNKSTILDSGISAGLQYPNIFTLGNFKNNTGNIQKMGATRELNAIFATSTLGYKNQLYLDASWRYDWSSTLVNTSQLGYPYLGLGLTGLINEMTKLPEFINFGKVRVAFGSIGHDIYPYTTVPVSTFSSAGLDLYTVAPMPGVQLKPERKNEIEIGTEWRMFDNRLSFEISAYNSVTKNQYIQVLAPQTNALGVTYFGLNGGSIQNRGIEAVITGKLIKRTNFTWDMGLNYSLNRSLVKELPESLGGIAVLTPADVNNYRFVLEEGKPFGMIQGVNIKRDNQGRIMLNTDGSIQKTKLEDVGNPNPKFMLGLSNSFKLGSFFANVLLDARFGGNVMSLTQATNDGYGVSKATGDARDAGGVLINAVYPDGTIYKGTDGNGLMNAQEYYKQIGDRDGATGEYVYDATNVNLRELSLGYTVNTKKIHYLQAATFSLIARNLFFIYKKAPFDPNVSLSTGEGLQGVDIFGMPSTRSIGLNISATF